MSRLDVRKTYKLYIGGKFPRSESGRSYAALDAGGSVVARVAQGSRKDVRDAVRAARGTFASWQGRTGYNRGQILYRMAEMIEDRSATFIEQIMITGVAESDAAREVETTIDRLVWYAGWGDKYAQVVGNLNPVAGPYFNISAPEPTGVVGVVAPVAAALLGLVSRIAPIIISGNTVVVIASEAAPLPAITLTEALATSDLPGGVVNVLTGHAAELVPWLAGHMDVNAFDAVGVMAEHLADVEAAAAENVKRVVRSEGDADWFSAKAQSPYLIAAFTETKTVWHPKGL